MNKLLIVVDYQNDFVCGALGFEQAVAIEDAIAEKIALYRQSGDEVAFTFDTHEQGYLETQEGKNLPVVHCLHGSDGWQLYGRVAALMQPGDKCFFKPSFGSGELFDYLRGKKYRSVELCGVVSNICVISNAVLVKTALPETPVIVDARCVAGNDSGLNDAALRVMESLQIEVICM